MQSGLLMVSFLLSLTNNCEGVLPVFPFEAKALTCFKRKTTV